MRPRSRRSWAWSEWAAGREGCHGKAVGALLRTSQQACKALPLRPSTCRACSTVLALPPCCPARRPQWDSDDHVEGNYQRSGLVVDANVGYGRNKRRDVLKEKVGEAGPAAAAAAGGRCWLPCSQGCAAPHCSALLSWRLAFPHCSPSKPMLQAEANPEQLDAEVQDDELRAAFAQVGSAALRLHPCCGAAAGCSTPCLRASDSEASQCICPPALHPLRLRRCAARARRRPSG